MVDSDIKSSPPFSLRVDTDSSTFIANQLHYAQLLSESFGGPFPELPTLEGISRVLDLGCGVGAWAFIVAANYPQMHIVGIDNRESAIADARTLAWANGKQSSAEFKMTNPAEPLPFPDDAFDLVNANTLSWKIASRKNWPAILKEAYRVVRPGGIIRIHELEVAVSNSPANQNLYGSFIQALCKAGLSYSVDGRTFGFAPALKYLLREAGCSEVHFRVDGVDISSGTEFHAGWRDNLIVVDKLIDPFVVSTGVVSQEQRNTWFKQTLEETSAEWYRGMLFFVTAWGTKPAG